MTDKKVAAPFKMLATADDINKAIASITTKGATLDKLIWQTAVSAMAHHAEHGDVTLVNRLVAGMPKGSRVNALRDFLAAHGKLSYNEESKVFDHAKEGNFDLAGALSKSWTEYKPEQEYVVIKAEALLKNLLQQASRETKGKCTNTLTAGQKSAIVEFCATMGVTA